VWVEHPESMNRVRLFFEVLQCWLCRNTGRNLNRQGNLGRSSCILSCRQFVPSLFELLMAIVLLHFLVSVSHSTGKMPIPLESPFHIRHTIGYFLLVLEAMWSKSSLLQMRQVHYRDGRNMDRTLIQSECLGHNRSICAFELADYRSLSDKYPNMERISHTSDRNLVRRELPYRMRHK
jgi:hypothetical protein